jgi:hypothetical protein
MQTEVPAHFVLHFQLYQSGGCAEKSWSEGYPVSLVCLFMLCELFWPAQESGKACFAVKFVGSLCTLEDAAL